MKARMFITIGALVAALAPGSATQAWTSKQVRDWTVECSNGLTCDMTYADWGAKGLQSVGFERGGAPDAAVVLKLRAAPDFSPEADPGLTYRFSVDGKDLLVLAAGDLKPDKSGMTYRHSDQAKVTALLEAMEAGRTAEVIVSGAAGRQLLPVKLNGVKAAMLHIDEVQGRLGRTDALEARGTTKPPAGVTAKDILAIEDMPEIVRKDFTESGGPCSDLEAEMIGQFQGFDVSVGTVRLIGVPCGSGGAYNQPYALYAAYDIIVERISFPYIEKGVPTTMSTAMNLDFNPATRTLTAFFRGRGIGDCGEYIRWRVDDAGGRLKLAEVRMKGDCDEKGNDPTEFPLVWKVDD